MNDSYKEFFAITKELKHIEKLQNKFFYRKEFVEQLNKTACKLQLELQAFENKIENSEALPLYRQLLRQRYIEGLTVRQIAEGIGYSEPHIYKLLKAAEGQVNLQ